MSWNWIAKREPLRLEPSPWRKRDYAFIGICFCVGLLLALALAIPSHDRVAIVSIPQMPVAIDPLPPLIPTPPAQPAQPAPPVTALPDQRLVPPDLAPIVWPDPPASIDAVPLPHPKPAVIDKPKEKNKKRTSVEIIHPFQ